jgi:hypothetical protein
MTNDFLLSRVPFGRSSRARQLAGLSGLAFLFLYRGGSDARRDSAGKAA